MQGSILLIEDDDAMRYSIAQTLELEGATVIQANSLQHAKRAIRFNFAGVILSDIRMPVHDGFDVLTHVMSIDAELPVIMLTGEADVPMALRALKSGAYDFLEKPCPTDRLLEALTRALAHRALVTKNRLIDQRLKRLDPAAQNFPGECFAVQNFRDTLRDLSTSSQHIHFYGEEGAGKKLAAYTLHAISLERTESLSMNLRTETSSITEQLLSAPEKLDLTIKNIDHGTNNQLQELNELKHKFPALRLITTSGGNWQSCVAKMPGSKIENWSTPIEIEVPNLKQRQADLSVIFEMLMRAHARNLGLDLPQIPRNILEQVERQNWEGNIPQMRNHAKTILLELNDNMPEQPPKTLAERMDNCEYEILVETLEKQKGSVIETADILGLPKKTLYDRLARHDIKPKAFK